MTNAQEKKMLENSEIRKKNIAILVKRFGSEAELNTALGRRRTDSMFYQIKYGTKLPSGRPRSLGTRMAREIEEKLGLDIGWMDTDHSTKTDFFEKDIEDNVLAIRLIPMPGSEKMQKNAIYIDESTFKRITHGLLVQDVNSCIVSDESMAPTMEVGDRLLIDTTKKKFETDGVYLVSLGGNNAIRRLKRDIDGSIRISVDSIPNHSMAFRDLIDVEILGKAIYLWNGKESF